MVRIRSALIAQRSDWASSICRTESFHRPMLVSVPQRLPVSFLCSPNPNLHGSSPLAQHSMRSGFLRGVGMPAVHQSWKWPDAAGWGHQGTEAGNSKLASSRFPDTLRHWNHKEKQSCMKHSRRNFVKIRGSALGTTDVLSETSEGVRNC